ncbi:hypothetical protein B0H11DRAFT_1950074 [Mycena galericulata]|nr:hypothetical protein B0H11DRAFT_1950074 [Mycena galericulata]
MAHTSESANKLGLTDDPFCLLNTTAFMIHSAIQTVRPDVLGTAHSHPHGKVFSSLGIPLDTNGHGSACTFLSFHSVTN